MKNEIFFRKSVEALLPRDISQFEISLQDNVIIYCKNNSLLHIPDFSENFKNSSISSKILFEFQDEISKFKISNEYLIVCLKNLVIYVYKQTRGKYIEKCWTISGDQVLDSIIFQNFKFILVTLDYKIRFYHRDLIIGEFEVESCLKVQLLSMADESDWTFLLKDKNGIKKYQKNIKKWEFNSNSSLVKYFKELNGIILCSKGNLMLLDSFTGTIIKEIQFHVNSGVEMLDLELISYKLLILLSDGTMVEIPLDNEPTPVNLTVKEEITLKNGLLEPRDAMVKSDLFFLDLELDSEFTLNLRILSKGKGIKKILVESQLLNESLFFTFKGIVDYKIQLLDFERNKKGDLEVILGYDSSKIYKNSYKIKKFNTCIYDPRVKLPGLVVNCSIGDYDIYSWIRNNFVSLPNETIKNGDFDVLKWRFKDQSIFVLEVLSTKIRLYGSNSSEFISEFLVELSRDYPLLQILSCQEKVDLIDLAIRGQNALECKQWEQFLLINSQIYKECKKLI